MNPPSESAPRPGYAHVSVQIDLTFIDHDHTWVADGGYVVSSLDLGNLVIHFKSADDARKVAAACQRIAESIDAKNAELERADR